MILASSPTGRKASKFCRHTIQIQAGTGQIKKKPKRKRMRKWTLFSLIMFTMFCMITNTGKAQGGSITGTVLSDDGTPLAGVTVAVSGTKEAVATNEKGEFTIKAKEGSTLLFSYIGYAGQKVKASAGMQVHL